MHNKGRMHEREYLKEEKSKQQQFLNRFNFHSRLIEKSIETNESFKALKSQ